MCMCMKDSVCVCVCVCEGESVSPFGDYILLAVIGMFRWA